MTYRMFLGALGALCIAFWCWLAFGDFSFMTTPLTRESNDLPAMILLAGAFIFGLVFTGFGLFVWRVADSATWPVAYVLGMVGTIALSVAHFGMPTTLWDWVCASLSFLSLSWAAYLLLRAIAPAYFGPQYRASYDSALFE